MSVNSKLSEKFFNLELNCVISVLRASSIQHLNINFMAKTNSCYKFYFNMLIRVRKKVRQLAAVTYQEYSQDESLYAVRTLDKHIARTEGEEDS